MGRLNPGGLSGGGGAFSCAFREKGKSWGGSVGGILADNAEKNPPQSTPGPPSFEVELPPPPG